MSSKLSKQNSVQQRGSAGFTLIEILIALAIFAVLAVISAVGLRSVIHTNQRVDKVDTRVQEILMATTIMRRDISQMVDRPVLNDKGFKVQSLLITDKTTFAFTRAGYTNPLGQLKRSSLQRLQYSFGKHEIIRSTWGSLDEPKPKMQQQVLLQGVKSAYISYVDAKGMVVDTWSTNTDQQGMLPAAIIFSMRLKDYGSLKMVIPIRGRGYGND